MFNATTVFELREFNKKKNKKNNMDKQWKIVLAVTWTESDSFMKYSMHSLVFPRFVPWNH